MEALAERNEEESFADGVTNLNLSCCQLDRVSFYRFIDDSDDNVRGPRPPSLGARARGRCP